MKGRWVPPYLLLLLLFSLVPLGHVSAVGAEAVYAEVIRVIDGDTIEVRVDGQLQMVRYLGIDAPEFDWARGHHQVHAFEATQANRELVSGREVWLAFDAQRTDVYGRLLAHVFVDEVHVNLYLVEHGFAQALFIAPNLKYHEAFLAAQHDAWQLGLGVWGTVGQPISTDQAPDYVGTFQSIQGVITQVEQRSSGGLTELQLRHDTGSAMVALHIYPESRALFDEPLETAWVGTSVQVTGLIENYGRGYRIVVRDPAMLLPLESIAHCFAACGE